MRVGLAVLGILVCALVLYPLISIGERLFFVDGRFTFEVFSKALNEPSLPKVARNTVVVVGSSAGLALLVAALLAWIAERTDATLGTVGNLVPVVSLFVPALAGAIGWAMLLSPVTGLANQLIRAVLGFEENRGPFDINTAAGMVFVMTIYLVPYAYLVISAALREIDPDLEAASRICGAGPARTLFRATLPSMRPALVSAAVILVMMGLAILSIPLIIGTSAGIEVISAMIYRVTIVQSPPNLAAGLVLSFFVIAAILVVLLVQWLTTRGRRWQKPATRAKEPNRLRLGLWKWPLRMVLIGYILLAVVLPLAALGIVSLMGFWGGTVPWDALSTANYAEVFDRPLVADSLWHSVWLSILCAILGVLVAFGLSWRSHAYRGGIIGPVVSAVTALPAGVPHIVMGVGFLLAFSSGPLNLYGTSTLLLLAYIAIWLPQAMQTARNGVRQVGRDLIEASQIAGASEFRTVRRIGLPIAFPQMTSGILLLFVLSLSEVNTSVMIVTPTNNTAGPTMLTLWETGDYTIVATYAVIICAINVVITGIALSLGGSRRRARRR
jgi:iron(III) transport system permease protein